MTVALRAARRPTVLLLLSLLLAVAGLAVVAAGVLRATVLAPERTTTARVAAGPDTPAVVLAPEALAADGPGVTVRATAPSGGPVVVAVGRAADVDAYLGGAARAEVERLGEDGPVVRRRAGEATVPAPSTVDVWALTVTGAGSAALTWRDTPGRWRLAALTDGSAGPAEVTVTWERAPLPSAAPALIVVGALLTAAGVAGAVLARRRRTGPGTGAAPRVIDLRGTDAPAPAPGRAPAAAPAPGAGSRRDREVRS